MFVYIDLEHDNLKKDPAAWERSLARRLRHKYEMEELSGESCLIIRYTRANPELLEEIGANAIVISGCFTDYKHYNEESLAGLRAIYHEKRLPTLGICAGFQLMAQTFGAEIGPIGKRAAGDETPRSSFDLPEFNPSLNQERGFTIVDICGTHPLVEGLGPQAQFFQAHYWEVKGLPKNFECLARNDISEIQAIGHQDRPLFGVQFHPTIHDKRHPDGRTLLKNFFHHFLIGSKNGP